MSIARFRWMEDRLGFWGVLPRDFEFPTLARTRLVVPEALDESIVQRSDGSRRYAYMDAKPGVSIESAAAQLQPLFRSSVESAPPPFRKELRLQVRSIRDLQIHDSGRAAGSADRGPCSASNRLRQRGQPGICPQHGATTRTGSAVRTGRRGRVRLFQQRLTESMLLALVGGAAGCGLAYFIVHVFVVLSPAGIPRLPEATVEISEP